MVVFLCRFVVSTTTCFVYPQDGVFRATESFQGRRVSSVAQNAAFFFFSAPSTTTFAAMSRVGQGRLSPDRSLRCSVRTSCLLTAVASSIFSAARRERGIFTRQRRADDFRNDAHASESSDVRHTTPRGRLRGDDTPKKHHLSSSENAHRRYA